MTIRPMFPLEAVLFPHALLPLHVFEPRYRVLMHDCLEGDGQFGVVLIARGSEVGGNDARLSFGTLARIGDAAQFPDGRWAVAAIGGNRLRVQKWLPDDPYPLAEALELAEPPWLADDHALLAQAEAEVRRALAYAAELGDSAVPATFELAPDPAVATWQLSAFAPLGPVDRQRLLEIEGHGERLATLTVLAREEAEVLAYRMSDG